MAKGRHDDAYPTLHLYLDELGLDVWDRPLNFVVWLRQMLLAEFTPQLVKVSV